MLQKGSHSISSIVVEKESMLRIMFSHHYWLSADDAEDDEESKDVGRGRGSRCRIWCEPRYWEYWLQSAAAHSTFYQPFHKLI